MARKVILATNNAGKAKELNAMLAGLDMEIVAQSSLAVPEVEETGLTFIENAILKARNAAAHAKLPAIAGAYVALVDAVAKLRKQGLLKTGPVHGAVAAVSVGIVGGQPVLDLEYSEDSQAETDMNVVMNDAGAFIEVQGTAEGHAFHRHELDAMLKLAEQGIRELMQRQREALAK